MRKPQKKGYRYEKTQAKKHRAKHIGGPGKPDYQRGAKKGEVKNWNSKVHSGVIKEAAKKRIKEIVSKSGFTEPAKKLAKEKGMKLVTRGK